jgi:hypothetical protein
MSTNEVVVISDGAWYVMTRGAHAPHPRAHRLVDLDPNAQGAVYTVCGIVGQAIEVEAGVRVYACQRCERRTEA